MNKREKFETFIKSTHFYAVGEQFDTVAILVRDEEDGGYIDANIHGAWLAYCAAVKDTYDELLAHVNAKLEGFETEDMPRPAAVVNWKPNADAHEVMKLEEFIEQCGLGNIIGEDGHFYYSDGERFSIHAPIEALPSNLQNAHPLWATHVAIIECGK